MNTYRVYVLDTSAELAPVAIVAYVRSEDKYKGAWQNAIKALNDGSVKLFADAEAKVDAKLGFGDHLKVAKIADITVRNRKLDKEALKAILADAKATPEEKLNAMTALLG